MTTMMVLLELNSLKLAPISFIATIDGASSGAIGAECNSPTTSSCGAITFTRTATTIQNKMIGTARMRSMWGKTGLFCSPVVSAVVVA
jgi:hypothetical protein